MKQAIPQDSFQKKMIWLTHEYPPFRGGVATYCYEVIKAAQTLELPFEVWSPKRPLECGSTLSPWNLLKMILSVQKREKNFEGCDLLLASIMAHRAAMILFFLGQLKTCRLHSLIHGSEILKFQNSWFWNFLAKRFFKKIKTVFVASEFSKNLVLRHFPHCNIVIAPCAVGSSVAKEIKSGHTPPPFRILTLARIHPRKGQLATARSLALLPSHLKKKIVYQIAGKGDPHYLQGVLNFCKSNQIACEYLGEIEENQLAETYAHADLLMMTSCAMKNSVEGFGISYLEAGWHGKPAIAFDTGGVSEAVLHNRTGLLVKENDLAAAAQAVQKLIEDNALRFLLGQQAADFARSFQWTTTAQIIFYTKSKK
ncbi:MAG: glycosyltransferase family 4 protein [Verrucomicrobiota bacterium]